jgi:hypothetical protein
MSTPLPSVALSQDLQFEWEFALQISRTVVSNGNTINLRMERD